MIRRIDEETGQLRDEDTEAKPGPEGRLGDLAEEVAAESGAAASESSEKRAAEEPGQKPGEAEAEGSSLSGEDQPLPGEEPGSEAAAESAERWPEEAAAEPPVSEEAVCEDAAMPEEAAVVQDSGPEPGGEPSEAQELGEAAAAPVSEEEQRLQDAESELGPAAPDSQVEKLPEHQLFLDPEGEDRERLLSVLEALLFASPEPLSHARLSEIVGLGIGVVKTALEELQLRLDQEQRPYQLASYGAGWRLFTRREFYPFLLRLRSIKKVEKLTPAALETLAIVAYRQPVMRADIEAIRGVKAGPMLRALLDRKLVRVLGRAEVPGAPLQYGTTQRFLDRFGLASLNDLPSLKEFQQGRI